MASAVIELQDVSLRFDADEVIRDVNLAVTKGEIFVVVGPSGHGKSVLLKMMAGLLQPTSGRLLIEGRNFFELDIKQRDELRRKMGMLFQKNALFDSLTAGENIAFPMVETAGSKIPPDEIDGKVSGYLQAVGLAHARNLHPDEISGGMQKRLGIARAIALKPEILFYDDPTAGLDPITSRRIVDLILQLSREQKSTAVAVTNDMNRAYQMASRIGMVVNGEFIITGTPVETQNHKDPRVQQFIRGELKGPLSRPEADV